jgi:glycosyltransferase involved in cell wall biosynthesis
MRILFVTHFFPPKHNAGTENYTLDLARALHSKGHEVEILCAEDWDSGDNYWNGVTDDIYDGVAVHRIHLNWIKARDPNKILYDSSSTEKWFNQFLAVNDFDLVHVTSAYSLGIAVLRSVKRAGIPLVLTLMDFWFICPSVQLLRSDGSLCDGKTTPSQCQSCLMDGSHVFHRLERAALPGEIRSRIWGTLAHITLLAKQRGLRGMLLNMHERKRVLSQALALPDVVISHSATVREMFSKNTSIPIEIIPNGHNISWLSSYQRKVGVDIFRFGYIGQIQMTKGVHILIEAFLRSGLDGKARLDIWGDYSRNTGYADQLRTRIGGDHSITLRGRYERAQLASVLAEIDVLIVPSLWYENAPLVIQEAFAAKIPVIATNLGGMAEAVAHEVNGLLFERGDADDLSRQLQRIVDEPELLGRLLAGIPPVKTIDEEVSELETIYQRLIVHKDRVINSQIKL